MAQLGIRDKNYRPNQYINPMLIAGREPNMEDAPYRIFDKSNPEHPDYDGSTDEDGDVQLELPLAKKNQNMTIAGVLRPQDFVPFTPATRDNDGFSMPYLRTPELRQEEMKHFLRFIENYRDGMVQRNTPLMLAKGKKKKNRELTIYEEAARRDFEKDMGFSEEGYGYDPDEIGPLDDLLDGV